MAIVHPSHPFAKKSKLTVAEWAQQIVFHDEASPARETVLKIVQEQDITLNVRLAIPSLTA